MSYYEILLFLHIGAAAIWIGSAFLFFVLLLHAKRSNDPLLAQRLGANIEWLAKRLFIPASLSVLVLGILLTIEGPWSFDQLWILLGLTGMATSFLVGLGVIEPLPRRCMRRSRLMDRNILRSPDRTAVWKRLAYST